MTVLIISHQFSSLLYGASKFTNSFYIEFLFLPPFAWRQKRLQEDILPKVTAHCQGPPQRGSNRLLNDSSSSEKIFPGESPDEKYAALRKPGGWKPEKALRGC